MTSRKLVRNRRGFLAAIWLELIALYVSRDNLTLNVLMLAWPVEAVKNWQSQL